MLVIVQFEILFLFRLDSFMGQLSTISAKASPRPPTVRTPAGPSSPVEASAIYKFYRPNCGTNIVTKYGGKTAQRREWVEIFTNIRFACTLLLKASMWGRKNPKYNNNNLRDTDKSRHCAITKVQCLFIIWSLHLLFLFFEGGNKR